MSKHRAVGLKATGRILFLSFSGPFLRSLSSFTLMPSSSLLPTWSLGLVTLTAIFMALRLCSYREVYPGCTLRRCHLSLCSRWGQRRHRLPRWWIVEGRGLGLTPQG